MINFCVEPKKPCRKNPIGELDFKIDKCYSSIYSRLCCHENDSVSHISQEERDEWNGKASNSALLDLQNQLNEVAGDGDNSIKKEVLIEVSRQIADAIADLNIEEYAKKKYVDDAISNIDFDQYITKKNADSTYLNKADYIKFDPTNYYTIAQIQKIIGDSTIGKDYPIESFTLEHNELILKQKNGGQFRVALSESRSGGGVNADYVQKQPLNYIKKNTLSKLIINDKAYSIESGRDIKIPISGADSSIDYTKFGYSKSYFKKHTSNSVAPSKPSANRPPEDGSGWVDDAPNQEAGYYIWMTQVFINGNGQYGEYTNPICLTGTAGESAVSYDIKTSTSTINYQDGTMYPKTISVYVVKSNGSQITNIAPLNGSGWSFSYSVDGGTTWTVISADQIQTEGDNGMLFKATNGTIVLNEYVPIVGSGINGSTELVIFDDQKIVAGMTSSKAVDESSPLNGKVTTEGKGDVRIWAGEISNANLATAPFTVTSNGNLTAHTATLYDATFYAENAQVKITNERTTTTGQIIENFENAGISISGNSKEYGDSEMFFGMQTSYPINIGGITNTKTSTPVAFVLNEDNKVRITPGRIDVDGANAYLTVNGTTILKGYAEMNELGCIIRRDSLKSELDSMCSVSINAGTYGSLEGDSITITLPDSELGRDIIIVNSKWNQLTVKVPDGYTLYKYGISVSEAQMSKYTMAHAIQIGSKAWIIGMMT